MTNNQPQPTIPPMPGHAPKPTTKRRTGRIIAAITAGALATGGGIYWLTRPSYNDIVKDCQQALVAQYKADGKGKPSACNDVHDDDYDALVLNAAMGNLGWLDGDGNFDKNKMLNSTQP
jgi:hypothetical protein